MSFPIKKSAVSHRFNSLILLLSLFLTFNFSDFSAQICNDPLACNFSEEATSEDDNCDFCSCFNGTNFTSSHSEYGVEIEIIAEHSEGELSGMTTYRLYFTTEFSDDEITSFTGLDEYPLSFTTDSSFYQEPVFGGATPSNASSTAISFVPNLAYDSWVTIGLDGPAVAPEANVSLLPGPWASTFENGESFTIDDGVGSGWYILPGTPNGLAGASNRILFSQLTTDGDFSGAFRVQVFPQGNSTSDERVDITFAFVGGTSDNICGCMSSLACNYNPLADYDDDSCEYSDSFYDCDGVCISDLDGDNICDDIDDCLGDYDSCQVCNGPGDIYECGCADIPQGDCDCDGAQLDVLGVCGGSCTEDIDSDGVCDDMDDCVGAYDSCEVCNGPGAIYGCGCFELPPSDCDCDGAQLDALNICGGDCDDDLDDDGICDDIDECVGAYDSCEVCNGPGAIYECGCADIPQGDCDCDGAQLDVLGVCGGSCTEDIDSDGICDDIDECVGAYDSCEVCNGPGAIYECGCSDIPQGDCDCDGAQLDIVGVCGGSCTEDIDSDGVCDDIDECVGAYDSCGVCNGPGAIYECGCSDIPQGDCDCDGAQLDIVGVCGGSCTEDINENYICDIYEYGCTDENNPNYNPNSAFDDGSCFIGGCISEFACNYSPEAEYQIFGACDFTSCIGCTDSEACNYDSSALIDSGSCNYANLNYNCDGECILDNDADGVCDEYEIEGCTDISNPGFNPYATEDDGSCFLGGCTLPFACNYDSDSEYLEITLCDFISCQGCMSPNACNYDPQATISSPASCTFPPVPFHNCNGLCNNDSDGDGICDEQEIGGCTDIQAVNYNPNATDDNGSCIIQVGGCVLPFACNYEPSADYYLPGSCDFSCLGGGIE